MLTDNAGFLVWGEPQQPPRTVRHAPTSSLWDHLLGMSPDLQLRRYLWKLLSSLTLKLFHLKI